MSIQFRRKAANEKEHWNEAITKQTPFEFAEKFFGFGISPTPYHREILAMLENTSTETVIIKKGAAIGITQGILPGVSGYITVGGCDKPLRCISLKHLVYDAPEDE